jgi:shikimate dehydrogenase
MNSIAPKAGVMGWPIGHSLSPRLHTYWLKQYNIAGSYEALAVEPNNLEQALRDLPKNGFCGINLTVPHKEKALGVMSKLDDAAKRIGAVNTVIVHKESTLEGRNTDAYGFTQNLLSAGVNIKGKPVLILGAGGAARAVIVALQDMGAGEIRLTNRTKEKANILARDFNIKPYTWNDAQLAMKDTGLLVNTTSLGMQGQPSLEISLGNLPLDAAVNDIVYVPLMTNLLQQAQKRGHKTMDGLGMLLHQARPAFAAFFGKDPEVTQELRRYILEPT